MDFVNARDEKDPNLMLDLMAFANNIKQIKEEALKNKYSNFPEDSMNPGWLKGWGVFKNVPWHFADLFISREEAEAFRGTLGADYQVANVSHHIGSNDFIRNV